MDNHDAKVVADLARASVSQAITVKPYKARELQFVHKDMMQVDPKFFALAPEFIEEGRVMGTVGSFLGYIDRFKPEGDALFIMGHGNRTEGVLFYAELDYHQVGKPSFCRHTVALSVEHSHQWNTWRRRQGDRFTQRKFSEFIEDNIEDVVEPDTGVLLTQIKKVAVERQRDSQTEVSSAGDRTKTQGGVILSSGTPDPMTLALKPWIGSEPMAIKARIYVHINDSNSVTFSYQMTNREAAIEQRFQALRALIEERTKQPVFV